MDKLDYLLEYLLKEDGRHKEHFGGDLKTQKNLYRALVNIREAKPISSEFLEIEDEYLQEELESKNVTDVTTIKTIAQSLKNYSIKNADKICLWQGDITKLKIDCIVNPANSQGLGCFIPNHNCIDNQIQTFAGIRLRLECNEYMKTINYNLPTSHCFITKGYNLPAKNVIHAVGPIVEYDLTDDLKELLADTYRNCLKCAVENNIKTISFPCISTGVFRFPKDEAAKIAIRVVDEFISNNKNKLDKVVFNLWNDEDVIIYERYI